MQASTAAVPACNLTATRMCAAISPFRPLRPPPRMCRGARVLVADRRFCPLLPAHLALPPSEGLTPLAALRNQSCTEACSLAGLHCSEPDLWFLNDCSALKRHFPCERGCTMEIGPDVRPPCLMDTLVHKTSFLSASAAAGPTAAPAAPVADTRLRARPRRPPARLLSRDAEGPPLRRAPCHHSPPLCLRPRGRPSPAGGGAAVGCAAGTAGAAAQAPAPGQCVGAALIRCGSAGRLTAVADSISGGATEEGHEAGASLCPRQKCVPPTTPLSHPLYLHDVCLSFLYLFRKTVHCVYCLSLVASITH